MVIIIAEFFVVLLKVFWAFVTAGAKWVVRPKEKSVAGQVCVITGAGSGLGRLFAKEFARRRAILVLWDINSQSNEETAEMVREIYHEVDTPLTKDGKSALFELETAHRDIYVVAVWLFGCCVTAIITHVSYDKRRLIFAQASLPSFTFSNNLKS